MKVAVFTERKLAVHLIAGVLMNQIFAVAQSGNHRENDPPNNEHVSLNRPDCGVHSIPGANLWNICEHLLLTGKTEKESKKKKDYGGFGS